jgi:ornithine--oxo-acid transaminase
MGDDFWRKGFGPLLPGTEAVPFGDTAALEKALATRKFAAYVVEPVQAEAGIRIPEPEYLRAAESLCHRYGTLLVLDEVQTGMYRTGTFLAAQHFGIDADMVILAKALSGGLVPSGAVLYTDKIYNSVYDSLKRSIIHTSTFGENGLAMRAGLATLDVLEGENLGGRAATAGRELRHRLSEALQNYEMVKEVRGLGMLSGIEFQAPSGLRMRAPFEAFRHIHPGMFGQMVVMRLFRKHGVLTQICGNNFMVLKVAPPLVADSGQLDHFVNSITEVVHQIHTSNSFWSDALGMARRALQI